MPSDPLGPRLLLQFILIIVSAFFASAEIVIMSLDENRLRRQVEQGSSAAAQMLKIVEKPTIYLSTIQLGTTLTGFLAAAFAADQFADQITEWAIHNWRLDALSPAVLHVCAIIVITLFLSYLILVLGQSVPKRIVMQNPETAARFASRWLSAFSIILRPMIWMLTLSTAGILRLLRIDPNKGEKDISEDEIRMMVDIGEEKGTIESSEKEMIENIFEFNNMTAGDVMVHRTDIQFIWLDDTKDEIEESIRESGYSRFPVCGDNPDDVLGVLITRDFFLNELCEEPKPLKEILRPAYFVPESVRTDILFRNMQQSKTHMAIVVDEYGGTSGLITMEDLLEEIVGNIYDESDNQDDENDVIKIEDNLWKIAGHTELSVVSEELDVSLPEEEEYDTLGGLIMDCLTSIPEDGSQPVIEEFGMHMEVQVIKDRRIEWVLISKIPDIETEEDETEHLVRTVSS